MSTGPKTVDNRGGARQGSGPKPRMTLTQKQLKQMIAKARTFAHEHGVTIDEILLGIIYDARVIEMKDRNHKKVKLAAVSDKVRVAAIKVWKDCTMGKYVEQNVNIKDSRGPGIYLPELLPDPATVPQMKAGNA